MTTVTKNRNKMIDDVITRVTLNLMLLFYSIHLCGKKGTFLLDFYGHKGPFFKLDAKDLPILLKFTRIINWFDMLWKIP